MENAFAKLNVKIHIKNIQMLQMSWVSFVRSKGLCINQSTSIKLNERANEKTCSHIEIPCRNRQWSLQSLIE